MEVKVYPDLEQMCRLCLKENAGTVCIFNKGENPEKYVPLSIPMRIMTCTSLEVQCSDSFPKKICTECRFQLEKSYYFRKQSQAADCKIRKHFRLISMGKTSKVFSEQLDEDDYDELELKDSLNFIKEQEQRHKQAEKLKLDSFIGELKKQNEKDLEKIKENLSVSCRKKLIPEIREELRKDVETQIQIDLEESIRKEVTEQCINQAKESLRNEVREECRKLEIKCLLDDLETYLWNKNKSIYTSAPSTRENNSPIRSISPIITNDDLPKLKILPKNSNNIEVVRMEIPIRNSHAEKKNASTENMIEDNQNINDEDCGSEGNFLIYEEGFDAQTKTSEEKIEYEDAVIQDIEYDDDFMEGNIAAYEKINDENIDTNDDAGESTSTTSYRIDNEDGEIKFSKKCKDDDNNNANDESNPNQKFEYKNIMVINIDDGMENEYVEHFEEVEEKHEEKEKNVSVKTIRNKKSQPSRLTRSSAITSETTFLTKTYFNPLQRCTHTPKIYQCESCPMVFSTKNSLERHLRTHRKIEKTGVTYQCPECRIVVSCSSALRRHMFVHCAEKPFACTLCDKAFVQKEILKRHMQSHTGIKPHHCPHCPRTFAQRINLTQHINRNHLEVPRVQQYPCNLCTKRFNHASGLSRHLASHSGVAFQCNECDRTFSDRSSIKRHIANMHANSRSSKDDVKVKN